jgi:hypothetical protein
LLRGVEAVQEAKAPLEDLVAVVQADSELVLL